VDDAEKLTTDQFNFNNELLFGLNKKNTIYAGIIQEYRNYFSVEKELGDDSYLELNNYPGKDGGETSGFGFIGSFDTRDNKHNSSTGTYIYSSYIINGTLIGTQFQYNIFKFDARQFFNPWYKHVIAMQIFTQANYGTTPFFALSKLGGTSRMRGYYEGAIRDKVIADAQIEYRMPIWKIFGVVAFFSTGRVADNYADMNLNGLWYAGGIGLRIMVDSKNKANLRIDFGYGERGSKSLTIGFTEAF
jgi:outer membrane translocation and assembly module TamA